MLVRLNVNIVVLTLVFFGLRSYIKRVRPKADLPRGG